MEALEVADALPDRDERHRAPHDRAHRQRGPAAGVAVELGQDHGVESDGLVEAAADAHGLLAHHGVEHQERVVGLDRLADGAHLGHQGLVDHLAPGGVADHHVPAEPAGLGHSRHRYRHGIGRLAEDRDGDLRGQDAQLLDRGGAGQVGAHEQRAAPLAAEPAGQLGGRCGLARALQSGQQHHRGGTGRVADRHRLAAEGAHQLGVHDPHHLLGRVQGTVQIGGERLAAYPVPELRHHVRGHVGGQQRPANLAQRPLDVLGTQPPLAPEPVEDRVEVAAKRLEHRPRSPRCR